MDVLHFSKSPLAGAPVRLVKALNKCEGISARLVDLKRWGIFEHDLVLGEDRPQIDQLIAESDIIHLHNTITLEDADFAGINFRQLLKSGKRVVRQYHSPPQLVARYMGVDPTSFAANSVDEIPSLVVAQYHERLYPCARVVPNIIDIDDATSSAAKTDDICFGYAGGYHSVGAWDDRWATKAAAETIAMLAGVQKRNARDLKLNVLKDVPHSQMLAARRRSRIAIDELVTGSYHISLLESMAAGCASVGYIDDRCKRVLDFITQSARNTRETCDAGNNSAASCQSCPLINTPLEHAGAVLDELINDSQACEQIGELSRQWMQQYYNPTAMGEFYRESYQLLLDDPASCTRQSELAIDSAAKSFFSISMADAIHKSRAAANPGSKSWLDRIKGFTAI